MQFPELVGRGGRTRVSSDDTTLIDNDLRNRIERLAAVVGHGWSSSGTYCHNCRAMGFAL